MLLHVQLWSWNYAPEPTAMGPIATTFAESMAARGHDVDVITSHPHYPGPLWGQRARPYRERRNGIRIFRLPLWIGHHSALARIREELTYALAIGVASPLFERPDIAVVVSPSFTALAPTMVNTRVRRLPWVLWLEDIFPDAATTTGLLKEGLLVRAARNLERLAYREADRIVVISEAFRENLLEKGVPAEKISHLVNPTTRGFAQDLGAALAERPLRMLYMGNIGYTQGLVELVRAFEASPHDADTPRLVIAGSGELADAVRGEIRSDRVEWLGFLFDELEHELRGAALGLVTQYAEHREFNLPSKLMNFMSRGIPVIASVRPDSEVARIVNDAGAGWVLPASRPAEFAPVVTEIARDPEELQRRGAAGLAYARAHFSSDRFAERFEELLFDVLARCNGRRS